VCDPTCLLQVEAAKSADEAAADKAADDGVKWETKREVEALREKRATARRAEAAAAAAAPAGDEGAVPAGESASAEAGATDAEPDPDQPKRKRK
jgi:hypothetical protein